jgi:hypothetical protein
MRAPLIYSFLVLILIAIPAKTVATASPLPPSPLAAPLAPTLVSYRNADATLGDVVTALTKASGIPITFPHRLGVAKCPVRFEGLSFWEALEQISRTMGLKITVQERGAKLALEPRGESQEVSSVSGPFRLVAKQVVGRALLETGTHFHEVSLEAHWEPRLAVFRIDAQPQISKVVDDRGVALEATGSSLLSYPSEAVSEMKIKLTGLTRASKQIGILAGEFRVTAAERILVFKFANLAGKLPATQTQQEVQATLRSIAKPDKSWEVDLELVYPEKHPPFESFEEQKWLRDNRLHLISPAGKPTEPESEEIAASGRRVMATYRFPGTLDLRGKGWALAYETPSPLLEFKVPFELKNIPLP